MVVFWMSPVHVRFAKLNTAKQIYIIGFLSLISLVMHRPVEQIGVIQNVVYFTPVYLAGMLCSQHKETIYDYFIGKEWILLLTAIFIAFVEHESGAFGNYSKPPFQWGGIELMFIQKSFLSVFFMVWLHRFESRKSKTLNLLAATSFPIFFMHPIIIYGLFRYKIAPDEADSWILYFLLTGLIISGSICGALIMRKLTPQLSK